MVDDLCVFRKRILSDAEVKQLVREQAGAMASPFAASDVTVAPDGLTGWTVKGLKPERYRFKLTDAGLEVVVKGGMAIIIR